MPSGTVNTERKARGMRPNLQKKSLPDELIYRPLSVIPTCSSNQSSSLHVNENSTLELLIVACKSFCIENEIYQKAEEQYKNMAPSLFSLFCTMIVFLPAFPTSVTNYLV
ncbi:hypothetical protein EUGRSUZ_E01236 [Eucalyptus grandis]|uniref:Uncharacterized protein n=2 Tax=Eucalyptus grandis TaxID=71139 RepID=A0A059C349_EUCGR|nr:hypothetical protein EUGRSUZ_E01236 [Eucalyptus grandis]